MPARVASCRNVPLTCGFACQPVTMDPGAQGRALAVLAETTAELNLRTIAQLAGISQAQASRLLPDLVALGVVERREVPPASLFRLVPEHVASRALLALARSTDTVLDDMGRLAGALPQPPVSVIVFGSFARREAEVESDIDVVVVRPAEIDEDDDEWSASLEAWRRDVARLTGNTVEVLEVSADAAATRLAGRVVHGLSLDELRAVRSGWARSHPARVGRAGPRLRRQGRGVRRGREQ